MSIGIFNRASGTFPIRQGTLDKGSSMCSLSDSVSTESSVSDPDSLDESESTGASFTWAGPCWYSSGRSWDLKHLVHLP